MSEYALIQTANSIIMQKGQISASCVVRFCITGVKIAQMRTRDTRDFVTIVEAAYQKLSPQPHTKRKMILTLSNRRDKFSGGTETLDSKEIAILCARIADNKKAEDILIFGVRDLTFIADFFVICCGFNKRQLQSIANDIELKLGSYGIRWIGMEGYADALWILIDYGDVIVHLFDKDMRQFYDLELLWGDAPKLQWKPTL